MLHDEREDLRLSIERMFDCKAMFLRSEVLFVPEVNGSTREVATFALSHPTATKAFAWRDVNEDSIRHRVVLQSNSVTTSLLALEDHFNGRSPDPTG